MPENPALRALATPAFSLPRLRDGQLTGMAALADGRDVLAVMPSGYGKSAIYQVAAVHLHADRERILGLFMDDRLDTVVATTAFGMGIDKPNVRFVIRADIPESLDAFY